ncbi:uncharacterized protein [Littorina saxatilis]|uniref:Uncharacterized protein n=1 Tax=Littorina saxatilis TaxID=31220 RepID=A0AAN9APV8_9CAEN
MVPLLFLTLLATAYGDQCTSHVLDSGSHKGAHGIGCVDSGCCEGGLQLGSLCSGSKVCCFSRNTCSGGGGSCTAEQKALACQLFNSANVDAFKAHPSGVQDNAFPYNNLRDMCNGHKASRSSYSCNGCHAPGGSVCLSTGLLKYLVDLKNHGNIIINELAGACHTCSSRHYSGLAVDLHNGARSAEFLQKCTSMGGWGQNEGDHIHCQFYDAPHPNGF